MRYYVLPKGTFFDDVIITSAILSDRYEYILRANFMLLNVKCED